MKDDEAEKSKSLEYICTDITDRDSCLLTEKRLSARRELTSCLCQISPPQMHIEKPPQTTGVVFYVQYVVTENYHHSSFSRKSAMWTISMPLSLPMASASLQTTYL